MANTNFQTIHQFGAGISQVVRQATGRDPVQNIEMEHVTVAQAKRLRIVDTFTGNPVTFTAEAGEILGAEVEMWIKQNLNGQSYPWPAGCGNNMFDANSVLKNSSGTILNRYIDSTNGTTSSPSSSVVWVASDYIPVVPGTILFFGEDPTTASIAGTAFYDAEKVYVSGKSATYLRQHDQTLTVPENCYFMRHSFEITPPINENWESNVYITLNSNPHQFSPYENICPITPWESVLVTVNDVEHLTEFPQPVYVGSFNTLTGQLVITTAITTVGAYTWIKLTDNRFQTTIREIQIGPTAPYQTPLSCSAYKAILAVPPITPPHTYPDFSIWTKGGSHNDVIIRDSRFETAAQFKTAMSDTQICYPLQDPIILQLNKEQIPAAEGENTVSTNANTLTVTLYEAV